MEGLTLHTPITDYEQEQLDKLGSVTVETEVNTYTLAQLWTHKDDEQRFLIPELIPDASVTVLIGEDGIGKTQILTQLCLSICLHFNTFLTLPLHAVHKRCLIVATEDSRQKFTKAIVKQAHNLSPKLDPSKVHIEFTEGSNFDDLDGLINEIKARLKIGPIDLIVIDALSDLFTMVDGEINSNTHARKILSKLQNLCNTYSTAIILIHHAAKSKIHEILKSGTIFITKDSSQGAGAITQKPRTVLALSNHKSSTSADGKYYDNYLHVVKANLMGKEYMTNALKLQFNGNTLCHTMTEKINIEEWLLMNGNENNNGPMISRDTKPLKPKENNTIHEAFVAQAFLETNKQYNAKELKDVISSYYAIGVHATQDVLAQLLHLNLIENHGGIYIKTGDSPF